MSLWQWINSSPRQVCCLPVCSKGLWSPYCLCWQPPSLTCFDALIANPQAFSNSPVKESSIKHVRGVVTSGLLLSKGGARGLFQEWEWFLARALKPPVSLQMSGNVLCTKGQYQNCYSSCMQFYEAHIVTCLCDERIEQFKMWCWVCSCSRCKSIVCHICNQDVHIVCTRQSWCTELYRGTDSANAVVAFGPIPVVNSFLGTVLFWEYHTLNLTPLQLFTVELCAKTTGVTYPSA